jgi:hypothetical protein
MKKIFLTGITTLALSVAFNLHAQNTNGWPIVSPYTASPTTTFNGALGLFSPLNSVALSPVSTNAYAVGGTNQVFIGTADSDFIGLQFISVIQTNTSAPFTTNLTGNITLRLAKTVDGVTPETTPSIILVLNSSSNTYSGAIPATGCTGHGCNDSDQCNDRNRQPSGDDCSGGDELSAGAELYWHSTNLGRGGEERRE